MPYEIIRNKVTQAITKIRLNFPSQDSTKIDPEMTGPSNKKCYYTRSRKRSLENKEKFKQKHGPEWWIEEGYTTPPSTPSSTAPSDKAY